MGRQLMSRIQRPLSGVLNQFGQLWHIIALESIEKVSFNSSLVGPSGLPALSIENFSYLHYNSDVLLLPVRIEVARHEAAAA